MNIIKGNRVLFFTWLLLISHSAQGWKLDVKVEPQNWGATSKYDVKFENFDFADTTKNPFYNNTSYSVAILIDNNRGYYSGWIEESLYKDSKISKMKTIGELGLYLQSIGYLSKTFLYAPPYETPNICFAFGFISSAVHDALPGGKRCESGLIPGNICDIKEPYAEINHGVVYADRVENLSASTRLHVSCASTLDVRVLGVNDNNDYVNLNSTGSLRSTIKINGEGMAKGAKIKATPEGTVIEVSSTLSGKPNPGEYSGSVVLAVAVL